MDSEFYLNYALNNEYNELFIKEKKECTFLAETKMDKGEEV